MSEWQPVETAPKDETPVLLFVTHARQMPEMITACWSMGDWYLIQAGDHAEDSRIDGRPTHWMPLPSPPTEESAPVKITPMDLVLREANHNAFVASILAKVSKK